MSLIKYDFCLEHPVGKGCSFFVAVLVVSFGWINLNTLGHYGYAMGLDNLWFLVCCVIFAGANARYGRIGEKWKVEYCLFGLRLVTKEYEGAKLCEDGKLYRLCFLREGSIVHSPIAFNESSSRQINQLFSVE